MEDKDSTKTVVQNPHLKTIEEVAQELDTHLEQGLSSSEAQNRISIYGKNKFDTQEAVTWPQILGYHLFNFLNLVMLVALALAFVVLSWIDAGVITAIILINVVIGFSQEYKSEKTLQALRDFSAPSSVVLRDGHHQEIPAESLVPGDILILKNGDKVPADARLIRMASLEVDESILTGESELVKKKLEALEAEDDNEISLGDRKNILFMNTAINKGKGRAIVFATGNQTEMGKIANTLMHGKKGKTPLQKRMDKLGIMLSIIAIGCIAVVLLTGWAWNTFSIYPDGLRTATAAAVSIIPQSIVVVTSLTLTVGVKVMSRKNALVRKLAAVETLGNITNICSDKTGTLTQGKMSVTGIRLPNGSVFHVSGDGLIPEGDITDLEGSKVEVTGDPILTQLITIGSLCNAAALQLKEPEGEDSENSNQEWVGIGSPTEVALTVLGAKVEITKQALSDKYKILTEFPFDSTIKRMSSLYHNLESDENILFVKGAPERILDLCSTYLLDDPHNPVTLTEKIKSQLKVINHDMADEGLRVLGLAYRHLPGEIPSDRSQAEQDCCFVGFVGIRDPPRDGVKQAIEVCHGAGIAVHMVTGDHPFTAKAIAKEVGIFVPGMPQARIDMLTMTAAEFNKLTDEELHKLPSLPLVIARCSPESKVRMVQELQRRGKRVAMLGDGVNDSPAIKLADIGVAMGVNGSDITKEAADIVLLDDNFSTVVAAVREGRRVFQNIRRFIIYLIASNIAEASVIVFGVAFSLDPPLTPMQILWMNLITAAAPAFILGIIPEKSWYMDKYKRKVDEKFYTLETIFDIVFYGFLIGGLALAQYCITRFVFDQSVETSQGATFANITILLMLHSYVCREMRGHFWRGGFLKAIWLHIAVLFGIGSLFFTFYTPVFETDVFNHRRPEWRSWLVAIASGFVFLVITEIYKIIKLPMRKRAHAKDLREEAKHDEYMLFNLSPEQLAHEVEDFPSNESEGEEDAHSTPPDSPSNHKNEHDVELEELQVVDSPLLISPNIHRRRSVHSPAPRSPYLSSPSLGCPSRSSPSTRSYLQSPSARSLRKSSDSKM